MTGRNNFTLLEVVIALSILALGVSGIMFHMSNSLDRIGKNMETFEQNHDLIQTAEYLLLCGPESELDESFLSGSNTVRYEYLPFEPEESDASGSSLQPGKMQLRTLKIILYNEQGNEVDSLALETFYEDETLHAN